MSHRVLITGASGYLGGTLLAHLLSANLPQYEKLYALVRTDAQAEAVKREYAAEPLSFNIQDEAAIHNGIVDNCITVVYYLPDPISPQPPAAFIKALAEVKAKTGQQVHFLFTSGAKLFSSLSGAPNDRPLLDSDPGLYDIQKSQAEFPSLPPFVQAVKTNSLVIDEGDRLGVRTYIFVPCIVYGKGEGFGNKISIQTVGIVKAAKALGKMCKFDEGHFSWPVCHVVDNTTLYIELLRKILNGEEVDSGKNGYYLASPGSVAWDDLYEAFAVALKKRGVIADTTVVPGDQEALEKIGALYGYPPVAVPSIFGGNCTLTAERGKKLGWEPQFKAEHIIEATDDEVDFILKNLP